MTVKELLDVLDRNREYDSQLLEVVQGEKWNDVQALATSSRFFDFIEDCEIKEMGAETIRISIDWTGARRKEEH